MSVNKAVITEQQINSFMEISNGAKAKFQKEYGSEITFTSKQDLVDWCADWASYFHFATPDKFREIEQDIFLELISPFREEFTKAASASHLRWVKRESKVLKNHDIGTEQYNKLAAPLEEEYRRDVKELTEIFSKAAAGVFSEMYWQHTTGGDSK